MNQPKQPSIFSVWWSNICNSLGAYADPDKRRLAIAFYLIGLALVIGLVGIISGRHATVYFNLVSVTLICVQGAVGACNLRDQPAISYILAFASIVILVFSLIA